LRVDGAYPVDLFEVSSDPSAIARLECCFERCGVVESPTHCGIPYVITHAVLECVGLSGRLKILDTRPRRLSLIRSREGQSLDAWVEWSWIQDIRRDCERPQSRKVFHTNTVERILTLDARPRIRQPPRDGL